VRIHPGQPEPDAKGTYVGWSLHQTALDEIDRLRAERDRLAAYVKVADAEIDAWRAEMRRGAWTIGEIQAGREARIAAMAATDAARKGKQ
jgi:hypothetical protein